MQGQDDIGLGNWASEWLAALAAEGLGLHSLAYGRGDGPVESRFWWPARADLAQSMHSVAKSFTGIAVGLAVADGKLGWDSKLGEFMGDLPGLSGTLASATVENLLTMRSGHGEMIAGDQLRLEAKSWVDRILELETPEVPGTRFVYSSGTSHLLSAMVQRVTGEDVAARLESAVFRPLGFVGHSWQSDPEGYSAGGNGLNLRTSDLWKWGRLCLRDGVWNGERLLPEGWVARATKPSVVFEDGEEGGIPVGYGHQIWCGPRGSFYASGIFGQNCFVLPDLDLVVAFTGGLTRDQHMRVQELLFLSLPEPGAFGPAGSRDAAPCFSEPRTVEEAPGPAAWTGAPPPEAAWTCGDNPMGLSRIALGPGPDGRLVVSVDDPGGTRHLVCGLGHWLESGTDLPTWYLHHSYQPARSTIFSVARRVDARTIEIDLRYADAPFRDLIRLSFDDAGGMTWSHSTNVNSGATRYAVACRPSPQSSVK